MNDYSETTVPSFETISDVCVPEDKEKLDALRDNLRDLPEKRVTYRIRRPDGDIRWIEEVINEEPNQRMLAVMRDVTEQKQLEQRLRAESVTDPLTGLFNRRQFNLDLKAQYSKFMRSGLNCALVMYDFDRFKNINDCHGHAMGDEVLKQGAITVNDQLRPYDHAYRLGGEEFAVLASGVTIRDAEALAERIRQSVEAASFKLDDTRVRATISLGIAQFRQSDNTFNDVLRRADEALYESKAHSRNTITLTE